MTIGRVHELDDVSCAAETPMAILCVLSDGDQVWVPKSQVHDLSDVKRQGDSGVLTVTWWFARKARWVDE